MNPNNMINKIKRAYYYYFYKIYKSIEYTSEQFGGSFWTDFKAGVVMIALEIWTILLLINYYNIFLNRYFHLEKRTFFFLGFIIIVVNYLAFVHTDIWKEYNKNFDKLPKEVNKKGSWIVFGITIFIIVNLIFSFYLMNQIDWSRYR